MQDSVSRGASTLELVVNEQQMQNMSQVDLTRSGENSRSQQQSTFQELKEWPIRLKESFNSKMNEAKANSNSTCEYLVELLRAFSSIFIWTICFLCTIIVPVILFFIGLTNLDNCPDRPSLPYLVFATGFVMTASNLFNVALTLDLPILRNHTSLSNDIKNTIASIVNIIFNCIVAFLYILCAYMVYTVRSDRGAQQSTSNSDSVEAARIPIDGLSGLTSEERNSSNSFQSDCAGTLYYFTFWFISLTLGFIVLLSISSGLLYAYNNHRLAIIRGSTPRSQPTGNGISSSPNVSYSTNGL